MPKKISICLYPAVKKAAAAAFIFCIVDRTNQEESHVLVKYVKDLRDF